eukprot:636985_1
MINNCKARVICRGIQMIRMTWSAFQCRSIASFRYQPKRIPVNLWHQLLFSTTACSGLLTYQWFSMNNTICIADNTQQIDAKRPKIAVITGGANGIGKGMALKCGKERFDTIIIIDINETQLHQTKQELSDLYPDTDIIVFAQDTTNKQQIDEITFMCSFSYFGVFFITIKATFTMPKLQSHFHFVYKFVSL